MSSSRPTTKRIHLTRHAQAEHNVAEDYTILDAPLTKLGQEQSRKLNELTKDKVQQTADLLVCSPLRRPMETMLLGYPSLKKRLDSQGKPVILLDILQECGPYPCDTPLSPVSKLAASNGGIFSGLDFSGLSSDYASKKGIFDPARSSERAREVRRWLRDRPEQEIVVVAHGDILRCLVDGKNSPRQWANAETKICTFKVDDDDEAVLVTIDDTKPKDASNDPTSSEMA